MALLGVVACGHTEAASPEPAPPPPPPKATGQEAPPDRGDADEPDQPTASDRMLEHFRLVRAARDAVIQGHLPGVHKPLSRLAEGEYGIETPQEWMPWLNDIQAEARRGVQAQDLPEAARAVAQVARQCGECHSAHQDGPQLAGEPRTKLPPPVDMKDRMERHQRAARLLWRGLTVPSHESWIAGANALTEIWVADPAASDGDTPLGKDVLAVSAMGPRLREAQTPHARAEAYGELIAACGACHGARRREAERRR